jgi:arylsulfatase A-like enzyme
VRQGKWKYLKATHDVPSFAQDENREKVEELYDLDSDIGETTNLAEKYPEKVAELKALMRAIEEGRE